MDIQETNHTQFTQRLNTATGLVEVVDLFTNEVVAYQREPNDVWLDNIRDNMAKVQIDGKEVLVQKGIDLDQIGSTRKRWRYSKGMVEVITNLLLEGRNITDLGENLPTYATIAYWRREYPEFEEAITFAIQMRAEKFLYDIEDVTNAFDSAADRDDVTRLKAKLDGLKYLTEKTNPERYGKSKGDGIGGGALQIIVNTGIIREEDEPIEVK